MIMSKTALKGVQVPSLRNLRVPAQPAASEIQWSGDYEIRETETGVKCGNHGRGARVYHADAANVRACYDLLKELDAMVEADIAAEKAVERYFEDRGYWEARAQEAWEESHGVW